MDDKAKYQCKKCSKLFLKETIFQVYIDHWLVPKDTLVNMCRRCVRQEIHMGILTFRMRNGKILTPEYVYDYLRMDEIR